MKKPSARTAPTAEGAAAAEDAPAEEGEQPAPMEE